MSTDELLALREKAEAATPGPWTSAKPVKDAEGWPTGVIVAAVARGQGIYANPPGGTFPSSDQDYIVAACNAVPGLIAEVLRLRGMQERAAMLAENNAKEVRRQLHEYSPRDAKEMETACKFADTIAAAIRSLK